MTFVPKSPTSSQYLWDLMYSAPCTDAFLNSMSMEAGETFIPANKHRHHSFRSLLYLSIKLSHWPTKIMHSLKRLWHNSQDKLTMNRRCFVFVLHLMSDAHTYVQRHPFFRSVLPKVSARFSSFWMVNMCAFFSVPSMTWTHVACNLSPLCAKFSSNLKQGTHPHLGMGQEMDC